MFPLAVGDDTELTAQATGCSLQTGVYYLSLQSQSHVNDDISLEIFDTGGCADFFPEVLSVSKADILWKFELWCLKQNQSAYIFVL